VHVSRASYYIADPPSKSQPVFARLRKDGQYPQVRVAEPKNPDTPVAVVCKRSDTVNAPRCKEAEPSDTWNLRRPCIGPGTSPDQQSMNAQALHRALHWPCVAPCHVQRTGRAETVVQHCA
jgi:hypothetical protein